MGRIPAGLLCNFAIETLLPEVRRNRFDLIFAIAVDTESPERRHLSVRAKRLLILARRQQAVTDAHRLGVSEQSLGLGIIRRLIRGFGVLTNLFLVGRDLIFDLGGILPRTRKRVCLSIETFITMATDAASYVEKIASLV